MVKQMRLALRKVTNQAWQKKFAFLVGFGGIICAGLILSFYAIVAGWMLSATLEPIAQLTGQEQARPWLSEQSLSRNIIFSPPRLLF